MYNSMKVPVRGEAVVQSITITDLCGRRSTGNVESHRVRKGYEIKNPLMIIMEQRSEEDYVACFHDVLIFGYGDTSTEALDNLKDLMLDQLDFLLKEKEQIILGTIPQNQLDILRFYIKKNNDF